MFMVVKWYKRTIRKLCVCCMGAICMVGVLHAQTVDTLQEVQLQVQELLGENQVEQVNSLIKNNSSLPPEFILTTLTKNLQLAKERNNTKEVANTYIVLGNFWFQQGNTVKAYNHLLQAETVVRKIEDNKLLGSLLLNKGNATENLSLKIRTYKEAVDVFKKEANGEGLSKVYLNLGDAYTNYLWHNPQAETSAAVFTHRDSIRYKETAFNYYKKADSINKDLDNKVVEGIVKIHMAEWYKLEKQFTKAIQTFTEAQTILEQADYPKGINYCILHIASIETRLGKFKEAITHLQQAEQMAKNYQYTNYLQGVYDEYVKAYDSLGNYAQALRYSRLNTKASLELSEIQSKDRIHALNLEYNQRENEYKLERAEAKNQLNSSLLIVSIVLLILTVGLAYLIVKNKKRKVEISELEKSAIEIKLNNKKLEEALLKEKVKFSQEHLVSFANQVNKIETFLEKLKKTVKKLPQTTETQEAINKLKVSLFDILNGQNYLKQLNTFTTKLNQDFFFYIAKHYDNITEDDEKLLSYIILDRSAGEISEILNISSASVYTKRYRLRQKLNLKKEESFIDFYNNVMIDLQK